ncbi:hypothetical protein K402DRAFT_367264 [Aulographum hederae CBS 113979]|uniref:Uncharacterized protein n=1 Tax=Aulographum hederae CBS 113979 TaxID=1176131 RepID=A0A6G1HFP5_9PEZI|nr:hypothetical protein K402DRAFT_367264 [Aulographum hederae CBS 113979]
MDSQNGFAPPPSPHTAPGTGPTSFGPLRRVPVQPPALTTSLSGSRFLQPPVTPSSSTLSTPFSPYASSPLSPRPTTPRGGSSPMAYRPGPATVAPHSSHSSHSNHYNPQEWGRNGAVGVGAPYIPHSNHSTPTSGPSRTRDMTGMEAAMPSPPPPYSPSATTFAQASLAQPLHAPVPSASGQPSLSVPHNSTMSPVHRSAVASPATGASYDYSRFGQIVPSSSPIPSSGPQFPPPPPRSGRDRSTSRTANERLHNKFSFAALTLRNRGGESAGPNAIEALRINTSDAISRVPPNSSAYSSITPQTQFHASPMHPDTIWSADADGRPPTSRRATSTGRLGVANGTIRPRGETESPIGFAGWEPGMPLPPPPPGPPPATSRSQSMGRQSDRSHSGSRENVTDIPAPAPRRPARQISTLGPVPPTPADWVDGQDDSQSSGQAVPPGLLVDTTSMDDPSRRSSQHDIDADSALAAATSSASTSSTASSCLTRTGARRDTSARGIRERRSESRAARERDGDHSAVEPAVEPISAIEAKPADLVLPAVSGGISRRRTIRRNTPTSARSQASPAEQSSSARSQSGSGDAHSSPADIHARRVRSPETMPTPPFSPVARGKLPATVMPPKALPTSPIHQSGDDLLSSSLNSRSAERPVSHIFHTPIDEKDMIIPLQPSRPSSSSSRTPRQAKQSEEEVFAQACLERHRVFAEKESAAATDQERLELFAEFMVAESRIRRDRYSTAFDAMAGNILDLTRDMWRSHQIGPKSKTPPIQTNMAESFVQQTPTPASSGTTRSVDSSPVYSNANFTPRTEFESPSSTTSQEQIKGENQLWSGFKPSLSPIPSMAMSTVPDEQESRGRSASRWWEGSSGDSLGRGGQELKRSKRESKYMGVPKELRENPHWEADRSPSFTGPAPTKTPQPAAYGPNEYPPEKVGLIDQGGGPSSSPQFPFWTHSAPATPDPYKMDVSRLVTLPPPYPRHHPAVNNNHPDLASIRQNYRSLSDLSDTVATRESFAAKLTLLREKRREDATKRRTAFQSEVQDELRAGTMSFSEAAAVEADFEAAEAQQSQKHIQAEFDTFQSEVVQPLHALFSERITKATASIEHIRSSLTSTAKNSSPNQPQEEGDEQPELLEKLTLLKWLYEAREALYRALFDLEGERNEKYKNIILLPYQLMHNEDKVREANAFFDKDGLDRHLQFEKEALKRAEDIANSVEENITRGVEDQLCAFWDIAPGLLAVVQKVPVKEEDLKRFDILIPPQELEENEAYAEFPMQYLYSLLLHAERAAYQFIESQTNLLCLLHEVRTGVMVAGSRMLERQRGLEGEDEAEVAREMELVRRQEEETLTVDLKEKVRTVETQWEEGLGRGVEGCRKRVERFLVGRGGWDESLNE